MEKVVLEYGCCIFYKFNKQKFINLLEVKKKNK